MTNSMDPLEKFERRCPPGGEHRVVLYFTSLRGVRKTFENCSYMQHILRCLGFAVDRRDVSMHADFKHELQELLESPKYVVALPKLFIKGRYIGGVDEVLLLHEGGVLPKLLQSLPTEHSREQCGGCGDLRFLPCPDCNGSCKLADTHESSIRCPYCNENGLIRCPLCY